MSNLLLNDSTAHFIMQGKGGVGKSAIATIIADYLNQRGQEVSCIDTDPANSTFSKFVALNVLYVDILKDENSQARAIDQSKFDRIIESISFTDGTHFVIDTGTSNYLEMYGYMKNYDVTSIITNDIGKPVVIHVPMVGGAAMDDCLNELKNIAKLENVKIVIWDMPHLGKLVLNANSKEVNYKETKSFKEIDNISGVVNMPVLSEVQTKDFKLCLDNNILLSEGILNTDLMLMQKTRIKKIRDVIFSELDNVFISENVETTV